MTGCSSSKKSSESVPLEVFTMLKQMTDSLTSLSTRMTSLEARIIPQPSSPLRTLVATEVPLEIQPCRSPLQAQTDAALNSIQAGLQVLRIKALLAKVKKGQGVRDHDTGEDRRKDDNLKVDEPSTDQEKELDSISKVEVKIISFVGEEVQVAAPAHPSSLLPWRGPVVPERTPKSLDWKVRGLHSTDCNERARRNPPLGMKTTRIRGRILSKKEGMMREHLHMNLILLLFHRSYMKVHEDP